MHTCYRPQTKFAKVMFLHVSLCPQGGVPGQVHPYNPWTDMAVYLPRYPAWQVHTPPTGTPRHVHPPGRYTPQAGTPPGQVHSRAGTPSAGTPRQVHSTRQVHTPRYTHPPPGRYSPPEQCMLGYGQQAGGMHPTGMHSCFYYCYYCLKCSQLKLLH